jgi:tRNA (cmo5U34)-methyltransferase
MMKKDSLDNWSQPEYAREYRDHSDFYIQDRATLTRVLGSYARAFLGTIPNPRVLDLGCGDGAVSEALHRALPGAAIVAADGSADMIAAARKRLAGLPAEFRVISFEEIIGGGMAAARFDGVFSALAIHHLPLDGKAGLFRALRSILNPGGHFLNVDVVTSETADYIEWHYALWREWILEYQQAMHWKESFENIPGRARGNEENHFDPLPPQLAALRAAEFSDVECHYRYGMFAVYGGRVKD